MPYNYTCNEDGCKHKIVVQSANFEANLHFSVEQHNLNKHRPASTMQTDRKCEKAKDINKSCIPKIEKGLHETSREEWRAWLDLWSWWHSKQPSNLDLTTILMGRFPRISAIEKLAVKKTNVIQLRQAMRTSS